MLELVNMLFPEKQKTKVWLKLMGMPNNKNLKPDFVAALELAPLHLHVLELLKLINSDFDTLKEYINGADLNRMPGNGGVFLRSMMNVFISKMEKALGELIYEEKKTDIGLLIWTTSHLTLDKLITGLVMSFLKTENQNPHDSWKKLRRIQEYFRYVNCLTDDWIMAHYGPFSLSVARVQTSSTSSCHLSPQIKYVGNLIDSVY